VASARFIQIDPAPVDPNNIHSFNRYAYGNNNPYRYIDPDGRTPVELHKEGRLGGTSGMNAYDRMMQIRENEATLRDIGPRRSLDPSIRAAEDAAREAPALLNGPIRLSERGMNHVIERHTANGIAKFSGKSKFNEGENIPALINSGTQQRMTQQDNGNFARTWDTGRSIGIDNASGKQTSVMTVITRPNGELVTAFPGSP